MAPEQSEKRNTLRSGATRRWECFWTDSGAWLQACLFAFVWLRHFVGRVSDRHRVESTDDSSFSTYGWRSAMVPWGNLMPRAEVCDPPRWGVVSEAT